VTEPDHPAQVEHDTPAAATDGAPSKRHGDPLLAASQGATEGTQGSRHGHHEGDQQDGRTVS
jgi:uncharacterized Zn-binding protein involved in type VI secretion